MKAVASLVVLLALSPAIRGGAAEAITSFSSATGIAEVPGGAGFAFSPRTTMAVTALGYTGSDLGQEGHRVILWNTNRTPLASAVVPLTTPVPSQARYVTISPTVLSSNQTYYLSAVGASSGWWIGNVLDTNNNGQTFTVSSSLTYLGGASGTNVDGTFPAATNGPNTYFLAPNFQFSTSPVIAVSSIQVQTQQVQVAFNVQVSPAYAFTLLQATQATGPWTTNLSATLTTNVSGWSYLFSASATNSQEFYRVRAP